MQQALRRALAGSPSPPFLVRCLTRLFFAFRTLWRLCPSTCVASVSLALGAADAWVCTRFQ